MTAQESSPPALAEMMLHSLVKPSEWEPISGDLLEEYREVREPSLGKRRANVWYVGQVLTVFARLAWPCLLLIAAITVLSLKIKFFWYGSVLPLPLVSLADAAVHFCSGYYVSQRTGLIRTGALVGAATSVTGFTILFSSWAIADTSLLSAPFAKPFIFVIVSVMFLAAVGYGVLAGALGAAVSRWPRQSQRIGLLAAVLVSLAGVAHAQTPRIPSTTFVVDNKIMRVASAGLDARSIGQPVFILLNGAGGTLDDWRPIFDKLSARGPVIAYDRRGLGGSEGDTVPQTFARVNGSLHQLLAVMNVPPPYILVGHSWGGAFVRAYASEHPSEIAGLVFLETTDLDVTRSEMTRLPAGATEAVFVPPPIPDGIPAGMRAEFENIKATLEADFSTLREMRPPTDVPVGVAIGAGKGAPPGVSATVADALLRLQIQHQQEWTLASQDGMLVVSSRARHTIQRDDPDLVLRLIFHVLDHAKRPTP